MKSILWAVEAGDYEQRYTMFVADSPELAESRIHETYSPPYEVTFGPMKDSSWASGGEHYKEFTIEAHFAGVVGISVEHTAEYRIHPMEYVKETSAAATRAQFSHMPRLKSVS